nr:MAG TPA: hypothetical protein [Caudoviricetes sp.]
MQLQRKARKKRNQVYGYKERRKQWIILQK